MPVILILLNFLHFALSSTAADEARCYWPDGSLDTTGYVCNTTATQNGGASACCLHNDACYESGSCFQDWSGVTYRQSCTDPTWRDSSCPKMCLNQGSLNTMVWIQQCNVANATACCIGDGPCCGDSSNFFTWKPGYITAVINGDGSNRLGPYKEAAVASSQVSSSATTAATSTPSRNLPSPSSDGVKASGSGTPFPSSNATSYRNAAIAVGAVLGVMWLVAFVGMIVFWRKYRAERSMRLAVEEKSQMMAQSHDQAYYHLPAEAHSQHVNELSAVDQSRSQLSEMPAPSWK